MKIPSFIRLSFFSLLVTTLFCGLMTAQPNFTNANNLLAYTNTSSGAPIGCADMNGDGLDDIVHIYRPTDMVRIQYQQPDGSFTGLEVLGSSSSPWSMVLGDVNEDGLNDILLGPNNNPEILVSNGLPGSYVKTELSQNVFSQGANFADIDTDGDLDIFVCHDIGLSTPYANDGAGNFTYALSLLAAYTNGVSDNSGNYATVWTDYDNDGDLDMYLSRCRLGVTNPQDPRRINQLFQNDGNNNYTDVAEAAGLMPLGQSWATDFADLDNDGDLDCIIINHDITTMIYEQTSPGIFTDRTEMTGLSDHPFSPGIQVMIEDFDNDGLQDVILTGIHGDLFMQNLGDFTFDYYHNDLSSGSEPVHTAAIGDLNDDGLLDLIAGRGSGYNGTSSTYPDVLLLNQGSADHHFLKVRLEGEVSNLNGVGARIEIYGDWGIQVREVRAGESYGISHSLTKHFGLGTATEIDSVVVRWPSGTDVTFMDLNVDGTVVLPESGIIQETIFTNVEAMFCDNDFLIFNDVIYDEPGTYIVDTLENTPELLNLLVVEAIELPTYETTNYEVICIGETFNAPDGTVYENVQAPFIHTSNFTTVVGHCDSIEILEIGIIVPPATSLATQICPGENYVAQDGTIFSEVEAPFEYQSILTSSNGCDSLVNETIGLLETYLVTVVDSVCFGEDYLAPDSTIFTDVQAPFTFTSNLLAANGCDSTVVYFINSLEVVATSIATQICPGESYEAQDGTIFTNVETSFEYESVLTSAEGCDSLVTETIGLLETYVVTNVDTICQGEDFLAPDGTLYENVQEPFTNESLLTTINGCDSIVVSFINVPELLVGSENVFGVCPFSYYVFVNAGGELDSVWVAGETITVILDPVDANGCPTNFFTTLNVINVDSTLEFTDNVVNYTGNGEVQQWLDCENGNEPIPGATGNSLELTTTGFVSAVVNVNGCLDTTNCLAFVLDNTEDPGWGSEVKIYPNPSQGQVTVDLSEMNAQTYSVSVHDLLGREVVPAVSFTENSRLRLELPTASAVYLLRIIDSQGNSVLRRVVVE